MFAAPPQPPTEYSQNVHDRRGIMITPDRRSFMQSIPTQFAHEVSGNSVGVTKPGQVPKLFCYTFNSEVLRSERERVSAGGVPLMLRPPPPHADDRRSPVRTLTAADGEDPYWYGSSDGEGRRTGRGGMGPRDDSRNGGRRYETETEDEYCEWGYRDQRRVSDRRPSPALRGGERMSVRERDVQRSRERERIQREALASTPTRRAVAEPARVRREYNEFDEPSRDAKQYAPLRGPPPSTHHPGSRTRESPAPRIAGTSVMPPTTSGTPRRRLEHSRDDYVDTSPPDAVRRGGAARQDVREQPSTVSAPSATRRYRTSSPGSSRI